METVKVALLYLDDYYEGAFGQSLTVVRANTPEALAKAVKAYKRKWRNHLGRYTDVVVKELTV